MRFLIGSILILSLSGLAAQAVTIDNVPAHVEYYRMPDQPLDPSYTTYSAAVDIPFSELGKTGMTKTQIIDRYLRLEGYKLIQSKGDVEITAEIGDFTIWMESRSTRRTKTKDKDGTEHTKVTYHLELKYSMPIALHVYDKKGFLLADKYISSNTGTRLWTSPSYNSLSELENYWRTQRPHRLSQLQKEQMEEGLKSISNEINSRFGYQRMSDNTKFETIGKKKHPEYEIFEKNVNIIVEAFKLMSADKGLSEIKTKIKPALDFYNTQAPKYKSSSKDDLRLRHIALYNQALAYYWMEDFAQAETFAKEIQRKDAKDKDAKRLLSDIEYTRSSLSTANRASRHNVSVGKT